MFRRFFSPEAKKPNRAAPVFDRQATRKKVRALIEKAQVPSVPGSAWDRTIPTFRHRLRKSDALSAF